jgi:hypothetical protein
MLRRFAPQRSFYPVGRTTQCLDCLARKAGNRVPWFPPRRFGRATALALVAVARRGATIPAAKCCRVATILARNNRNLRR